MRYGTPDPASILAHQDQLREDMRSAAIRCVYLVNADQIDAAHRESEAYLSAQALVMECWQQLRDLDTPGAG